jgi:hypothetical protein
VRAALAAPLLKRADGPDAPPEGLSGLSPLADVLGWRAGPLNAHWGGPRPVTNLLVGAGLGSLGGYGLGRLAEEVLPAGYFEPKALRRRAALMGGIAGALPPIWQGYDNVRTSGGDLGAVFDQWPAKAADGPEVKEAAALFDPVIDRDEFNREVMAFGGTPMPVRAATAGLVEAASAVAGRPTVTPWDVARVAVGAGTGLVSGVVAGKALGFLAGLTPEARQGVQRIGLWTGLLNAAVPRALGLSPNY